MIHESSVETLAVILHQLTIKTLIANVDDLAPAIADELYDSIPAAYPSFETLSNELLNNTYTGSSLEQFINWLRDDHEEAV